MHGLLYVLQKGVKTVICAIYTHYKGLVQALTADLVLCELT